MSDPTSTFRHAGVAIYFPFVGMDDTARNVVLHAMPAATTAWSVSRAWPCSKLAHRGIRAEFSVRTGGDLVDLTAYDGDGEPLDEDDADIMADELSAFVSDCGIPDGNVSTEARFRGYALLARNSGEELAARDFERQADSAARLENEL